MSYQEQLRKVKDEKRIHESISNRYQGDPNSINYKLQQSRTQAISGYYDREIERLTDLAIQELIAQRLQDIDYNVTLNGDKITDAIITQFSKGFPKR